MPLEYKGSLSRYRRYLQTVRTQPLVRASLWVALSLILTITMILAALKPTLSTIASLMGQIEQEKKISAQLDDKIRTMQIAGHNLEQVRPQLPLLAEAMPDQPNWKDLADRLNSEATQSGIALSTLVVANIPIKGPYINDKAQINNAADLEKLPAGVQKVDILIGATGKYEQFKDYITKLEKLRRIITLSSVSISKDLKGNLNLTINGFAIFNNIDEGAL